ncbi:MAG: uracil-DNA glycosylase [Thermoplasmatota archaeon]
MKDIQELNEDIEVCERCILHETRKHALPGEGDTDARVMLIAQAPGEKEDKEGRMFVGPSGKILDDLLENAGVGRDEIYITNLIKCMLPDYRKPKQDEIEACSYYLDEEIRLVGPAVMVPLGYYATRYLFEKYGLTFNEDFAELTGNLYLTDDGEEKVYPVAHPAALIYDDSFEEKVRENYRKLKTFLEPCKWYQVCPMKRFYNKGILDRKWVDLYCKGDWKSCVRFQKERDGVYHPDSMLPNGEIDEALEDI